MGDAQDVRQAISGAVPGVDWSDPAWGIHKSEGFSIVFNFQASGPVEAFTLHVRGGGDPLPTIVGLCSLNGWVALDHATGELIDLDHPSQGGWVAFQRFRDKVIGPA